MPSLPLHQRAFRPVVPNSPLSTARLALARGVDLDLSLVPGEARGNIGGVLLPSVAPTRSFVGRAVSALVLVVSTAGIASAQIGTSYCTPVPNSTGSPATISGSGSASVSANNLRLTSSSLPLHASAYFLCSRNQGFVLNPGGSAGHLCLGTPIGRRVGGVIPNSGATGIVNVTADLTVMPQPSGTVVVLPGETWNFQCWFRDAVGGVATSNFSDGLAVLFTAGGGPTAGMVPIPAGTFLMGSNAPNSAPYYNGLDQQPVHQVTISYPFWMGRHEVTQAEYQTMMGANPSYYPGASRPVERVSWHNARAYCAALTAQQAGNLPAGYDYRVPTEAEWEYACRAGTTTEFHYGPDLFCNQARFGFSEHSNSSCNSTDTVPVGNHAPNAFGLYDMHGNVWEWCLDSYAPYTSAAVTDPFVTGGLERVSRGGGHYSASYNCRSAVRRNNGPGYMDVGLGFRVVLAPILVP
jgi:formylglycine-generating enzyme required for sulfatase activity